MNKSLLLIAIIAGSLSLTANAGSGKHKLTPEQQALKKEMLDKYDTNHNGRLDRKERANMSKEDRERVEKAGLDHKHKRDKKADN